MIFWASMSNGESIFHFKEFSINHSKSAMKVGTDGVLLGAWSAIPKEPIRILDIGTGTGLIAIMMAQRTDSSLIDAIDIEEDAFIEAESNFHNSPWSERLSAIHSSVQEFQSEHKYDLIISNPPFYEFNFHSVDASRSVARQQETLNFSELIQNSYRLLKPNGLFSIIIPSYEKEAFIELAEAQKLFLNRICSVKGRKDLNAKRVMMTFSKQKSNVKEESLIIEIERHKYTDEYIDLVKDFYLNM